MLQKRPAAIPALEAVLSTYHNPETDYREIRGKFESGRGWYYGAGVLTYAAPQPFLSCLARKLPEDRTVPLAEAFLSNKAGPTCHANDARCIATRFWSPLDVFQPAPGSEPTSPLSGACHGFACFPRPRQSDCTECGSEGTSDRPKRLQTAARGAGGPPGSSNVRQDLLGASGGRTIMPAKTPGGVAGARSRGKAQSSAEITDTGSPVLRVQRTIAREPTVTSPGWVIA
jgi:hypothetical protein